MSKEDIKTCFSCKHYRAGYLDNECLATGLFCFAVTDVTHCRYYEDVKSKNNVHSYRAK